MDSSVSDANQAGSIWAWAVVVGIIFVPLILKLVFGVGAKRVMMKNPQTGQIKKGYWGFSWTYLMFGWWVPLLRGELSTAALHLLFSIITFGLWQLIVSFLYNGQFTNRRIAEGFKLADAPMVNQAAAAALGIDLQMHHAVAPA